MSTVETPVIAEDHRAMTRAARTGAIVVIVAIALAAVVVGHRLRRNAFLWSGDFHFRGDVTNAFMWGDLVGQSDLFSFYDRIQRNSIPDLPRRLDYTPLRLAAVSWWVHLTQQRFPDARYWQDDYEFTRPMLRLNTIAEFTSSVLVFFIVRLWVRRDHVRVEARTPGGFRGLIPGLIGALLFWFNPAVLWDSHCWPQWDVWLMPFFLAAVLLASLDWWFAAGACVCIGAFLKGQMLLGAPVLLLWPLFERNWSGAARFVCGIVSATAFIAFPWMRPRGGAMVWYVSVIVVLGSLAPLLLRWKRARARLLPHVYALVIALAVFAMIPLFGASSAWYTQGFEYGTEKFSHMLTGNGSWNLPKMMRAYLHWPQNPDTPVNLPLIGEISFTTFSRLLYSVCLVLCGVGAAMQSRRHDKRFLVAMVAPWVCFFVVLTQMHGRYLVWAAGFSALLAGVNVGVALLGILVSIISWLGIMQNQFTSGGYHNMPIVPTLRALDPHLGWVVLMAAAIFLYVALSPPAHRRDRMLS